MKVGDILYFSYAYGRLVFSAPIIRINKKSVTIEMPEWYENHTKTDKLIDGKVRGCNEYYTAILSDREYYTKTMLHNRICAKFAKVICSDTYIATQLTDNQKLRIIKIAEE